MQQGFINKYFWRSRLMFMIARKLGNLQSWLWGKMHERKK